MKLHLLKTLLERDTSNQNSNKNKGHRLMVTLKTVRLIMAIRREIEIVTPTILR